jgi:hypothetical protein
MILVKADDVAKTPLAPSATHPGQAEATGPRRHAGAMPSDSFDNIDQLLDGPIAVRASRPAGDSDTRGDRWRTASESAAEVSPQETKAGASTQRGISDANAKSVDRERPLPPPAAVASRNSANASRLNEHPEPPLSASRQAALMPPATLPGKAVAEGRGPRHQVLPVACEEDPSHDDPNHDDPDELASQDEGAWNAEPVGLRRRGLWIGFAGLGLTGLIAGGLWYQGRASLGESTAADDRGVPQVRAEETAQANVESESGELVKGESGESSNAGADTPAPGVEVAQGNAATASDSPGPEDQAPPQAAPGSAEETVAASPPAAVSEQGNPDIVADAKRADEATGGEEKASSEGPKGSEGASGNAVEIAADVATAEGPDPAGDELSELSRWLRKPGGSAEIPSSTGTQSTVPVPAANPEDLATRVSLPAEAGPAAVTSRPLPPPIDVAARLRVTVAGCRYENTPLIHFLRDIGDLGGLPISLDPAALSRAGVDSKTPVSFRGKDQRVDSILDSVLGKIGLAYVVDQGQLWVVGREDSQEQAPTRRYDVRDLVEGDPKQAEALADWVKQLVDFGSWQGQVRDGVEGQGQIDFVDGQFQVTQSGLVHVQVEGLLQQLRQARNNEGAEARTSPDAELARFDRRITVRSTRGATLHRILASIEEQAGITVFVDWASAYEAGWAPSDEWRFFCVDMPLRDALQRLFESTGLTYRVVGLDQLQVVSSETLSRTHEVRFYPLRSEGTRDVQRLCRSLAQELGRDKFQPQGPGALAYDPRSRHLIVSLPQPDQMVIRERLQQTDSKPAGAETPGD